MKKFIVLSIVTAAVVSIGSITGCKTSEKVLAKSGAQIWGENCIRCHNPADPSTFSDIEWDVAAMHMQLRANLTVLETEKVIEFLKSAN